jgi:hypothetical protein
MTLSELSTFCNKLGLLHETALDNLQFRNGFLAKVFRGNLRLYDARGLQIYDAPFPTKDKDLETTLRRYL